MYEGPLFGFCCINVCINLTLGFVIKRVGVVGNRKEIKVSNLCSMPECFFTGTCSVGELGM